MRKTTRLKRLIQAPELLVMPGAFDPISARIAQDAGFQAVQCSGFAISAVHAGLPDYSFLAMTDMLAYTRLVVNAVDIPVMADGDTGFGNAVNAWYAVREFERIGCAGINIEDQVLPKRCGHLQGKQLIPLEEAQVKIRACAEARSDADFVINARTDALAVGGIDEVVARGNAYLAAGATMVFVDGVHSRQAAQEAVRRIRGPVGINLVEGGKSPEAFTFAQMQAMGLARVSLPATAMLAAIKGMQDALRAAAAGGGVDRSRVADFAELQRLVGFPQVFELEARYLAG